MLEYLPLIAKIVNTLVLLLIAYGLWVRHRPEIHMKVMITCFVIDVINVLIVEIGAHRDEGSGAVAEGVRTFTEEFFSILTFHILMSVACIVCYIIAIVTGRKLHRTGEGRARHKKNAMVFIVTRLLSWVTSFFVG